MVTVAVVPLLVSLLASDGGRPPGIAVPNGTVPPAITLVGSTGGVPASSVGSFVVNVHSFSGEPISGASVVVDFSSCFDIQICADQLDPAALVNCPAKTVRKFSDVQGNVTFTILGSSVGGAPATGLRGAHVYANGALIGSATVATPDLDGHGGVGIDDLSIWLSDFGSLQVWGRSDLDYSGALGVNDLSAWLTIFGATPWVESCGSACP